MNLFIKISIITLLLDSIYIYLIGYNDFNKMVNNIQNSEMKVNYFGAFLSYLFIISLIYYFIILNNLSLEKAFLLGFLTYGVFDATNLALFTNYDFIIALKDTLWGGILFYLVAYIMR